MFDSSAQRRVLWLAAVVLSVGCWTYGCLIVPGAELSRAWVLSLEEDYLYDVRWIPGFVVPVVLVAACAFVSTRYKTCLKDAYPVPAITGAIGMMAVVALSYYDDKPDPTSDRFVLHLVLFFGPLVLIGVLHALMLARRTHSQRLSSPPPNGK